MTTLEEYQKQRVEAVVAALHDASHYDAVKVGAFVEKALYKIDNVPIPDEQEIIYLIASCINGKVISYGSYVLVKAEEYEGVGRIQDAWIAYKQDMRPETRNDFLRVCSSVFDAPTEEDKK